MVYEIQSFPSLVENNNTNLSQTAKDLLHGLKIQHNNKWYICIINGISAETLP